MTVTCRHASAEQRVGVTCWILLNKLRAEMSAAEDQAGGNVDKIREQRYCVGTAIEAILPELSDCMRLLPAVDGKQYVRVQWM